MMMGSNGYGWTVVRWGAAVGLLAGPWVAMRFTAEVNWSPGDFVVFGAMLACVCGTWEFVARRKCDGAYRGAVGMALATAFLALWIDLAVGIAGPPGAVANRVFPAVLALGVAAAVLVRGRAAGMMRVMLVMALAQTGVGLAGWVVAASPGPVVGLSLTFVGLWSISAGLFARAVRAQHLADGPAGYSARTR